MLTLSTASFKKFFDKLKGTPSKKKEEKPADAKPAATEPAKATETKPADAEPAAAPTATTEPTTTAAEGKKKETVGGLWRKIVAHFCIGTATDAAAAEAPKPAEPAAADAPAATTEPTAAAPTETPEAPKE